MDRTKTLAGVIAMVAALASCGSKPALVVGSKNFTEQVLLAEILAQHIERRLHVVVGRKFNLGGTLIAQAAITSGAIDLYPEYSGTALTAVLHLPAGKDPAAVMQQVREAYRQKWQLEWLPPLGFNNTFAMMVRGDIARRTGIRTLSDAARTKAWKLGAGYEFKQRPDGLAGLLATYGLRPQGDPVTMDLGLLYAALKSRKVEMIAANSTDGLAAVLDVKMLEDDRHYFPPYECAVVARESSLARFPGLDAALRELSGKLSDPVMRKLNFGVDGEHRPPAQVAARFLDATFGGATFGASR
ncbi:MAG: Substrate-binding region of ABC-type glycine betaine transport system [Candidatus Solibacter sp.]|nr:Substrate-binding region of ABC-type glycine betaine transport system [Candidatus Solibacter sp.]